MKLTRIWVIGLAAMLAWANLAVPQERPKRPAPPRVPEGVRTLRDLQYVEGSHERNRLDLYLPEKAEGRLPLIVWIHGGAWQASRQTRHAGGAAHRRPCPGEQGEGPEGQPSDLRQQGLGSFPHHARRQGQYRAAGAERGKPTRLPPWQRITR